MRKPKPRVRFEDVLGSEYGHYPWDGWQTVALLHHIPAELARLGRDVIREAYQHGWPAALQIECGWKDDGRAMLKLAQTDPAGANARWSWLLDTDGGIYDPKTGELRDRD